MSKETIISKLADFFFKIAVWLDPRLPDGELLRKMDAVKYGTGVGKRIDPREFYKINN